MILSPRCSLVGLAGRAYDGGEHAVDDGLTPGQRRKVSVESAGKRAALAETGAWTELLRLYVRDMLAREHDARGDGTHTLQQSTTLKADTMPASDKMDSCNIRAALQILRANTRAHRRTYKLLLRFTRKLLLTQTNGRLRGSNCNVQRPNKLL